MITAQNQVVTTIHADELTQGDVITHLGQTWEVCNEPQYKRQGIVFDVLCLEYNETQTVTFHPAWKFELITHNVAIKEVAA